jgi:hypothetical protein
MLPQQLLIPTFLAAIFLFNGCAQVPKDIDGRSGLQIEGRWDIELIDATPSSSNETRCWSGFASLSAKDGVVRGIGLTDWSEITDIVGSLEIVGSLSPASSIEARFTLRIFERFETRFGREMASREGTLSGQFGKGPTPEEYRWWGEEYDVSGTWRDARGCMGRWLGWQMSEQADPAFFHETPYWWPPPLSPGDGAEMEKSERSVRKQLMKRKSDRDICDGLRYGHPDYLEEASRRQMTREVCQ